MRADQHIRADLKFKDILKAVKVERVVRKIDTTLASDRAITKAMAEHPKILDIANDIIMMPRRDRRHGYR